MVMSMLVMLMMICRRLGRQATWLLGAVVGCGASITVFLADGEAMRSWGIYVVAVAFGASSSVLLITR